MTTRIVLVRHATCAQMDSVLLGRTIDSPLDARGERQAQALAEHLASLPDLLVEASPRRRAQQTAAAIARRRCCDVQTAQDMDEIDFGSWSGLSFAALARDPEWRQWNERRGRACTPSGDDIAAVQSRAMTHLQQLRHRLPSGTVAIVTHAEIIRAVLLHCLSAPADDYHRIEISPASLTTLSLGESGAEVNGFNERIQL